MTTHDTQPDAPEENPHEDELDVEGPNESTQPSTAPEPDEDAAGEGEVTES